jgi:hypothetical protein
VHSRDVCCPADGHRSGLARHTGTTRIFNVRSIARHVVAIPSEPHPVLGKDPMSPASSDQSDLVPTALSRRTLPRRRPAVSVRLPGLRRVMEHEKECPARLRTNARQHHRWSRRDETAFARSEDHRMLRCPQALSTAQDVPSLGARMPVDCRHHRRARRERRFHESRDVSPCTRQR